jgi:hypothetical protein
MKTLPPSPGGVFLEVKRDALPPRFTGDAFSTNPQTERPSATYNIFLAAA